MVKFSKFLVGVAVGFVATSNAISFNNNDDAVTPDCPSCCNLRGWFSLPCGYGFLNRPDSVDSFSGDGECCCPGGVTMESQCLKETSIQTSDLADGFPFAVGGAELPPALRGVFWLGDQGLRSSLVSFGQNPDGQSGGPLNSANQTKLMVHGDRSWTFADPGIMSLVKLLDLSYLVTFNSAEQPTFAQIHPEALGLQLSVGSEFLLDWSMRLLEDGLPEYPGSVIWRRDSEILGIEVTSEQYDWIQVIDENGEKLPAFTEWLAYNENKDLTGDSPGTIWYFSKDM